MNALWKYEDHPRCSYETFESGISITRRMQCIVGSLYAVYTAAIFGVVQNNAR